jgi:hypothetical protein
MADKSNDPAEASPNPAARPRSRPTPTIDLKATEIEREAEPGQPPQDDIGAGEPQAEIPENQGSASPPGSSRWPLIAAGAIGGGAILCSVLWLLGVLSPLDGPAVNARLAQIESRLGAPASAPAADDPRAMQDLASRVGKLESSGGAARGGGDPDIAIRLAVIEEAVKSLSTMAAGLTRRVEENAAAVREARDRADTAKTAAETTHSSSGEVEALANRMGALERSAKTSDDLAKRVTAAGDRPLRLAVSAQALRSAVERGDPFAAELAAVKALISDPQAVAPLEPFAGSGVPAPAALARQLSELTPVMRQLAAPPPAGGFLDRLQANAERLVRVRPAGEAAGDDPVTVIGRVDARAGRADIAGALAELAKLPASVRAPAEEWINKAQARTDAVDISRRIASDALAALGKTAP